MGLGALALGSLFGCMSDTRLIIANSHLILRILDCPKSPPFAAKAKSVIYLHMAGAPSQLELFDYKPELMKMDGQDCPPSLLEGKRFAFIRGVPKMLGPQAKFAQHGQSRAWISEHLPHFSTVADEVSFLKAVTTDQFNHAPAQLLMHTGSPRLGRPSMGAWVTYGLGTENQNLPGFVVLTTEEIFPMQVRAYGEADFFHQFTRECNAEVEGDPVLFIKDPNGMSRDLRKASIDAINEVNKLEV